MANTGYELVRSDGARFPIGPQGLTLGRHPSNNVVISDPSVSRMHARLLLAGGRCWIRDEKSKTGVFVNQQLIRGQQELRQGDLLTIGTMGFQLIRTAADKFAAQQRRRPIPVGAIVAAGALVVVIILAFASGIGGTGAPLIVTNAPPGGIMPSGTQPPATSPMLSTSTPRDPAGSSPPPTSTPRPAPTSPLALPTAGDLTQSYRTHTGMTIRYPSGWDLVDEDDLGQLGIALQVDGPGGPTPVVMIQVDYDNTNPEFLSRDPAELLEFMLQEANAEPGYSIQTLTCGAITWHTVRFTYAVPESGERGRSLTAVTRRPECYVIFAAMVAEENWAQYESTFEAMVTAITFD
ncbi:MAG: FHA domain-containing protein [Anaerolineales bacterium]